MGFLDLHSHVLPGLDDGAPDPETSMAMLRGLASIGFDWVCATPHQKAGQFMPSPEAIASAMSDTTAAIERVALPLKLSLAAENMWDSAFFERARDGAVPSYDGGAAFLVELPLHQLPIGLGDHLFRWSVEGRLPVLAHPERYELLWKQPDVVERLRTTCAMVVDLGALAGYHGRRAAKIARRAVKDGLVHAAASDAHTPADVRCAAEGIAWIRNKLGDAAVTRLLDTNPRRIFAGEHPDA